MLYMLLSVNADTKSGRGAHQTALAVGASDQIAREKERAEREISDKLRAFVVAQQDEIVGELDVRWVSAPDLVTALIAWAADQ